VVFRGVKYVIKHEFLQKEPEKIQFELKEESVSIIEEELEDEEPQTPAMRRSVQERRKPERCSPTTLCSIFSLSFTSSS